MVHAKHSFAEEDAIDAARKRDEPLAAEKLIQLTGRNEHRPPPREAIGATGPQQEASPARPTERRAGRTAAVYFSTTFSRVVSSSRAQWPQ